MMVNFFSHRRNLLIYFLALALMTGFALWIKSLDISTSWQRSGMVDFSLGFVLLAAYISGQIVRTVHLPLISGYIFAGIIAGPHISGLLTGDMVIDLRLVDDLALSFIALSAGGALHLPFLKKRGKRILLSIVLQTIIIFGTMFLFVILTRKCFNLTRNLSFPLSIAMAVLLGVVAIARSPSSAIAVISECRAFGPFTDTVLGITVAMDVLIIILFTLALTVTKIFLAGVGVPDPQVFLALFLEMSVSIVVGILLGKGISSYINWIGHDLPLLLLFLAFGATKASLWLGHFVESQFNFYLHLEPLLICMSAGFAVQNFSKAGPFFMENLERITLPVYVLFFSLAGASLNLDALRLYWPMAVCLAVIRAMGILGASWLAGTINADPSSHNQNAWMAYITQAGVSIGLAQLAQRQFPEIGVHLTTLVLAVIFVNQVVGPITFKLALNRVGEARKE
jgi:Kef-type K+ transport system membrane component KefB